ncbi:MAG: hypothetical protein KBT03_07140 [Bacteroidales bacterium]|nr:hypothetical protein [Candidatus Scybalousia scybalohippi]
MDIYLDQKTEDLVLQGGDLVFVKTRQDEVTQRLYLRLKTFKREWFLDLNYGIDYLNDVFGVGVMKSKVDAILQTEIIKDLFVESITSFSSKVEGYKYSCEFTIKVTTMQEKIKYYLLINENKLILTDNLGNQMITRL